MKKTLLIICFSLILAPMLYGQRVSVESTTEEIDTVKFNKLVKGYNRIIMAEREELSLLTLDLIGPLLYVMSGIDSTKHNVLRVGFEHKFKPEWSWHVAFEGQANKHSFTELRYRGGLRYYFNMTKRILKGKSANNFSANYLSARFNYKRKPEENDNQISIDLLFGIQRRLWKFGFIDFDVGIENLISPFEERSSGIDFTSSIKLGIAF